MMKNRYTFLLIALYTQAFQLYSMDADQALFDAAKSK